MVSTKQTFFVNKNFAIANGIFFIAPNPPSPGPLIGLCFEI